MGPIYLGKKGTFVNFRYINNLASRLPELSPSAAELSVNGGGIS